MAGFWSNLGKSAAAMAMAALALVAPQAASAKQQAPALWKLADEDTTIYLFGTFHMLPKDRQWRTPAFENALRSSDELVLEIADVSDQMAAAQSLMKLGMSQNLPPLIERVPADKRPALQEMIKESAIPAQYLDRMETWAASLMLAGVEFKRLGLDPDLGVERTLTQEWKGTGKPVRGLETAEEQFGFFDGLPEDAQRAFLVAMLESPDQSRKQFQEMLQAWLSGDVNAVARTFDDETLLSPQLRKVLMTERNARWADWLAKRMDAPGTVFLAVGAGHLAGPDSVAAMLARKGLKITRLQ